MLPRLVMVYALELPVLLVLLVTASTDGATSISACNGVVAMISGPCNGVVAEPFCRFAPYPVEGASLTRDEDVGAIRASEIIPSETWEHLTGGTKSARSPATPRSRQGAQPA